MGFMLAPNKNVSSTSSNHDTSVSVASKSLLSGDFPDDDDSACSTSYCSNKNAAAIPSMVVSSSESGGSECPMCRQISTLSVNEMELEDDGIIDDLADVNMLAEHAKLEVTKNPSRIEGRAAPTISEDAKQAFRELIQDREQLERILIARKYQLEAATDLLLEQVRFRARWKPAEIKSSDIPNALPSGAWRICGYTRDGYIISNYKLSHWDPNAYGSSKNSKSSFEEAVDEYVRYVIFMLELMIREMKRPKFCLIFDLKGFSPSLVFRKNVRAMIVKLIYVAQAQYPERLQKVMLVNAPMGFESAWRLIKPILDEKTASKIGFCSKLSNLLDDIDRDVLAKDYGGTHDEYPLPK